MAKPTAPDISSTDAVIFLLDKEMRREKILGRPDKAKKIEKMIHDLGGKTISEQEAEAEEARQAKIAEASQTTDE